MLLDHALQRKAYEAVAASLPFALDATKVRVTPGISYVKSPVKAHDYAVGVMAAFGSVVEHLGRIRGLPAQTMHLDRRRCGLLLNGLQLHFQNGYSTIMDTWGVNPDNGTYRAKDGRHVTMIGIHPHLRDRLLVYLDCTNTAQAMQAAVEKKTAQELEDDAVRLNLPLGIVRTPAEWLAHPVGAAVATRPLIDFQGTGSEKQRLLGPAKHRPLEGVRVVELTHMVAGPNCARQLAEQGADVIKVQPPMGDWVLPIWMDASWGKKNILLDIKGRRGKARFHELLATADVLVDGQRPGSLAKLGFDDAGLRAINPNLVHASLSCFPIGTPWGERPGFEQIAQAVSGTMHVHSEGMAAPTVVPALINDYLTGYLTAIGVVAALAEREQRGGFYHVAASLARCSTLSPSLAEKLDAELYEPVRMKDLVEHAIDQPSPAGIFTRIAAPVEFSHTPSMVHRHPTLMNSMPDTTGWDDVPTAAPQVPHYPSQLAREGGIYGLVECFGIEDRSDGGGIMSLASKSLFEYVMAHRHD
ncbi:MAG: CoA transferase [Planctomycetia bacterium]|nr:CoA transferase [Planctomycetia bacterium]